MIKQIAMVSTLGLALVLMTAAVYTQSVQAIHQSVLQNSGVIAAGGGASSGGGGGGVIGGTSVPPGLATATCIGATASHNPNCPTG